MRTEISDRQLGAAFFVLLLSPALRLFPSFAAQSAGKAAPLAALLAFFPAAGYLFLVLRAAALRREGEGLGELLLRAAPGRGGRFVLSLLGAWLLVYAGFVLRSGADRFIVTVYPDTPAAFFVLTMAAAALAAAFAPLRGAARCARLFLPPVALVLALVLGAALPRLRRENLLPLGPSAFGGLFVGTLGALDVLVWAVGALCLLLPETKKGAASFGRLLRPLAAGSLLLALLGLCLVGCFGAPLTGELSWPFFSLVRSLVFFRSVERIEALVVALWIFPDFLIAALFLRAARRALSLTLARRLPILADGRLALPLCAAAAAAFALLAAPDAASLARWSRLYIPAANLFFSLVLVPGVLFAGKRRRRI